MTPTQLAELLGEPPVPHGSWERAAVYASAAALRSGRPPRAAAEELAARLRGRERIAGVRVRDDGFLMIEVACPGEIVREIVTAGPPRIAEPAEAPPDHPRTWDNPGFVVRYAHARAAAVERWADALGVPWDGFRPELLADPHDRAVLRLLAEPPSRGAGRDPRWAGYAERLALAYHDAHERAPAVPRGESRCARCTPRGSGSPGRCAPCSPPCSPPRCRSGSDRPPGVDPAGRRGRPPGERPFSSRFFVGNA